MSKTIAIIPARKGSKSVPNKNIKELGGKPLLFWTIDAALEVEETEEIDEVWVTTDYPDAVFLDYYGADAFGLHKRPAHLAADHVQTDEVYCDFLHWYMERYPEKYWPDTLILLQPTSPFRDADVIRKALALYDDRFPNCTIVSTVKLPFGYYWQSDGPYISPIGHNPRDRLGRQWDDYNQLYKEEGAIYVTDAKVFSRYRSYRIKPFFPLVLEDWQALEIDTPEDWDEAERIYQERFANV